MPNRDRYQKRHVLEVAALSREYDGWSDFINWTDERFNFHLFPPFIGAGACVSGVLLRRGANIESSDCGNKLKLGVDNH